MATIEIYRDHMREWRWRLVARNGRTIADSAEGYTRKAGVNKAVARFLKIIREENIKVVEI